MHGAYSGGRYFVIGVSIFGLFYAFDLLIMHILPPIIGADAAMAWMRVLHQEWSWVANVIALGLHRVWVSYLAPKPSALAGG